MTRNAFSISDAGQATRRRFTAQGAPASQITAEQELRRTVMSCLLWEKGFYESGEAVADRITRLIKQLPLPVACAITREASQSARLRHTPLFMAAVIAKEHNGTAMIGDLVTDVITRADSLSEMIAMVAEVNGLPQKVRAGDKSRSVKKALSHQVRNGIARAMNKFDEYQFAKYDRENLVTLQDAVLLCHPKPNNPEQAALYKRILDKELFIPDTWETELSKGSNKGETFTRLIKEERLGYLALLRNLRLMTQNGVDQDLIKEAILARKGGKYTYPFRFLVAAKYAPQFIQELNTALLASLNDLYVMEGRTAVLVDVSQSMSAPLAGKSEMTRMDAACTLGAIFPGQDVDVYSFSNRLVQVHLNRGLEGARQIAASQYHGGTDLVPAVDIALRQAKYDRVVVISDEEANNSYKQVEELGVGLQRYIINVGHSQNGIGYGAWTHIHGFSENIFRFMEEFEKNFRTKE